MNTSKIINIIYLIYLIIFSSVNTMKITETQSGNVKTTVDNISLTKTCLNAMMEAIPAEYCWKKGADFGTIPYDCPVGYFRSLALCYENCGSGYTFFAGVCWASCGAGYTNHGMSCYKSLFDWYFKNSYIPGSLTNFSEKIPCPNGMYKSGALCYTDCKNLGMENCGIGACSSTSEGCLSSIATMTFDTISGIASMVGSVITLGGSTSVKTAVASAKASIKNMASRVGKSAMSKALDNLKKVLKSTNKNIIMELARRKLVDKLGNVKDYAKEMLIGKLNEFAAQQVCSAIWNTVAQGTISAPELNLDSFANSLDVFNIQGVVTSCQDTSSEKGAVDCAKNVLEGIGNFDPSGLLTIASTFMHATCELPKQPATPPSDEELAKLKAAAERIEELKRQECMQIFQGCNFTGDSMLVCDTMDLPRNFNDLVNSIKVGSKASGLLFEDMGFGGKTFPLSPGLQIECFENIILAEGYTMRSMVSNILMKGDDCLILRYVLKKELTWYSKIERNYVFCPFHTNKHNVSFKLPWQDIASYSIITYKPNIKVTFFSSNYFKGISWSLSGNFTIDKPDPKNQFFNEIKSFVISLDQPNINPNSPNFARYVEIRSANGPDSYINISQVVVRNDKLVNIAKGKPVVASSRLNNSNPATLVDGNESARAYPSVFHSANPQNDKVRIDLQANSLISFITIYNRSDCCNERIVGAKVVLLDEKENVVREITVMNNSSVISINLNK